MAYQQLPDLANLHVAELRQAAAAEHPAAAQHRVVAGRVLSLRTRAGWTLVTLGLSLAIRPPASRRLRAG
jgi:hypothetical protein